MCFCGLLWYGPEVAVVINVTGLSAASGCDKFIFSEIFKATEFLIRVVNIC